MDRTSLAFVFVFACSLVGCAEWRVTHCNFDRAYQAGMHDGRRKEKMGAYPTRCEEPDRPVVERGYREGYLAGLGCGTPPPPSNEPPELSGCGFDYAYRAGMNDGRLGKPMRAFGHSCADPMRTLAGYQEGYRTAVTCRPPPPAPVSAENHTKSWMTPRPVPGVSMPEMPSMPGMPSTPVVSSMPAENNTAPQRPASLSCCVNKQHYVCSDSGALDRCSGRFARCMAGCMNSSDPQCGGRCAASNPPDPSACTRDQAGDSGC